MYTDISIDLETLDTSPRSLILSIGICPFNRDSGEIGMGHETHVSVLSQCTRTMTVSTVIWWMKQSKESKKVVQRGQATSITLRWALNNMFGIYVKELCDLSKVRVWGNGAAFDNAILEDVYKNTLHKEPPWRFCNDRCLRTLMDEYYRKTGVNLKDIVPFVGERHGALSDAVHQAKLVIKASR